MGSINRGRATAGRCEIQTAQTLAQHGGMLTLPSPARAQSLKAPQTRDIGLERKQALSRRHPLQPAGLTTHADCSLPAHKGPAKPDGQLPPLTCCTQVG